jgi:hypothetical protein
MIELHLALELSRAFSLAKAPGHIISDEDSYHDTESFLLIGRFEIIEKGRYNGLWMGRTTF